MALEPAASRRTRRRWPRRLVVVLVLLGGVLFLAPSIIARTSLRSIALGLAGDALGAGIEVQDMSLGWFSPVYVQGLQVRGGEQQPLLAIDQLSSQLPLWRLLWNSREFGEIRIDGLTGELRLRPGGSNWEDLLLARRKENVEPQRGERRAWPRGAIVISQGEITVSREGDAGAWLVQPTRIKLEVGGSDEEPLTADYEIQAGPQGGAAGRLLGRFALLEENAARGRLTLAANQLPLGLLGPVLTRLGWQAEAAGAASLRADYQWADHFASHHLQLEQADFQTLQLAAPEFLGADVLHLDSMSLRGQVLVQDSLLELKQVQWQSDLGRVQGDGQLRLDRMAAAMAAGAPGRGLQREATLEGSIDLARLARLFPRSLHVREDTQITGGQLNFQVRGAPGGDDSIWQGNVRAEGLAANTAGRAVRLAEPITVELRARQAPAQWLVDQFTCRSSFLAADGQGSLQQGSLTVDANLQKLHAELSQFVDLAGVRLAGQARSTWNWKREQQQLQAAAQTTLQQLAVEFPGYDPVSESRLQTNANCVIVLDDAGTPAMVQRGRLEIVAAADQFRADLIEPAPLNDSAVWDARFNTEGDLDSWLRRLQPVVRFPGWTIAGRIAGGGRVIWQEQQVVLRDVNLDVRPLRMEAEGVRIQEPRVQLQAAGVWNPAEATWTGGPATLVSSTIAARSDNLTASAAESGLQLRGDISIRGDLRRLNAIFESEAAPRNQQLSGEVAGALQVDYAPQGVAFRTRQTISRLELVQRRAAPPGPQTLPASVNTWEPVWSEPQIEVSASGLVSPDWQAIQLSSVTANAEGVALEAAGGLGDLSQAVRADLAGQVSYDLSRLIRKMQHLLGESIQVEGASTRPFRLSGPLVEADAQAPPGLAPAELTASAGVGWERANLAGVPIGPGQVQAELQQGVVRFEPIEFDVSQGRLRMSPAVDLRGATPVLRVQPGQIAEGLTMTPQMAQTWLQYVAPIAAGATAIEGVFGAEVRQFDMPMSDLKEAVIAGRLTIQEARVGPGPMAQPLLQLANQVEGLLKGRVIQRGSSTWIQLPPQQIEYSLAEGRVHHQGVRILIDELEIRTQGSVGLDQSLAMVAEVIPPPSWLGDRKLLGNAGGRGIQIQIGGTLQRPQLDRNALQQLARQMVGGAAQGALEGELDRALRKLFK